MRLFSFIFVIPCNKLIDVTENALDFFHEHRSNSFACIRLLNFRLFEFLRVYFLSSGEALAKDINGKSFFFQFDKMKSDEEQKR